MWFKRSQIVDLHNNVARFDTIMQKLMTTQDSDQSWLALDMHFAMLESLLVDDMSGCEQLSLIWNLALKNTN